MSYSNKTLNARVHIFAPESCSCKDLVNRKGVGNCQGTMTSQHRKVACYVHLPSSCKDLAKSSTNPGEKLSAEACITPNHQGRRFK